MYYAAAAVLAFSACSTSGKEIASVTTVQSTVQTTTPGPTNPDQPPVAAIESACPSTAGPTPQIDWENLRELWAAADPMTPSGPAFETGEEFDFVQLTFVDETIVQGTVNNPDGILSDVIVISEVNPQDPFANMPSILEHWVALLTITEPLLEPRERVAILVALGVVGDNLSLVEMNGSAQCGPRTYEVVFDIELAAFVFGAYLTP